MKVELKNFLIKCIKYKRFLKTLNKIKSTIDHLSRSLNLDYDSFCKILQNKKMIDDVDHFLFTYYDYTNQTQILTGKKFLLMFLLVGYPSIIMSVTHQELINSPIDKYPHQIYHTSVKLINCILELCLFAQHEVNKKLFIEFTKSIDLYSNSIDYFLQRDKIEEITKLVQEYYDVNEAIMRITTSQKFSSEEKAENETELNKIKNKIFEHINFLDKSIKKEELEIYSNMNLLQNLQIEKTHFDIMLNDIKTKKLLYFKKSIDWIKKSLIVLGALKTTHGYDIEDILDCDFMGQKIIISGLFENTNVVEYGDYIMRILKELQSVNCAECSSIEWEVLIAENLSKPTHVFLANMIFFMIKIINEIFDQIHFLAQFS